MDVKGKAIKGVALGLYQLSGGKKFEAFFLTDSVIINFYRVDGSLYKSKTQRRG